MKIGILTQPLCTNYGGLLQNYALQQVLVKLGHDPITLDQKEKHISKSHRILSRIKAYILHCINPQKYKKQRYRLTQNEERVIRQHSVFFIEKNIRHSKKCAGTCDFLSETKRLGLEAFVVGSDQCWRPCYNLYLKDMFLGFTRTLSIKKRVAYAVSFGSDNWEYSEEQTRECAMLAKMFDAIMVREISGVELCKTFLGVEAVNVLDPTLLLNKEDYINVVNKNKIPKSKGDLFTYILDPSSEVKTFIRYVENKTGLNAFQVLPKFNEDHRTKDDVKYRINDCIYPSPLVWLRAFIDAEMTIVDSFHGMVFSILFNKPFWVIGNEERGISRFRSLLSKFGLESRLLSVNNLDAVDLNQSIEWKRVNDILQKERFVSLVRLKESLE